MWRQSTNHIHSLRWEEKTAPWEFQTKLLHYFFLSNNKSNLHSKCASVIRLLKSTPDMGSELGLWFLHGTHWLLVRWLLEIASRSTRPCRAIYAIPLLLVRQAPEHTTCVLGGNELLRGASSCRDLQWEVPLAKQMSSWYGLSVFDVHPSIGWCMPRPWAQAPIHWCPNSS